MSMLQFHVCGGQTTIINRYDLLGINKIRSSSSSSYHHILYRTTSIWCLQCREVLRTNL